MRRYRLLMLVCVLIAAVAVPVALANRNRPADAEALVIAQTWNAGANALPRYGETVFDNGQVAEAVVAEHGGQLTEVVPNRVSLATDPDSIVLRVIGHDTDVERAADVANTAADAFVSSLNQPGAGVGQFILLAAAVPEAPTQVVAEDTGPPDTGSRDQILLAALLGSGLLAVGLAVGVFLGWALRARADQRAGSR